MKSLADLKIGEKGKIQAFLDDLMSLKLLEMGCLPETEIKIRYTAPLGDPICVEVAGSHLCLRLAEAKKVLVKV